MLLLFYLKKCLSHSHSLSLVFAGTGSSPLCPTHGLQLAPKNRDASRRYQMTPDREPAPQTGVWDQPGDLDQYLLSPLEAAIRRQLEACNQAAQTPGANFGASEVWIAWPCDTATPANRLPPSPPPPFFSRNFVCLCQYWPTGCALHGHHLTQQCHKRAVSSRRLVINPKPAANRIQGPVFWP
jgi:hypothetical protein